MNLQANSSPVSRQPSGGRHPLLWAALAFAAGIAGGVLAWRPSLRWVMAFMVYAVSSAYLSRRRWRSTFALGMAPLFVLGALAIQAVNAGGRLNDESPVMKFVYGKTSVLPEGDAERRSEQRFAKEQPDADLLRVAHHGSAASTTPQLLTAVHPHFALISVGARNTYGHPRAEVPARLEEAHVLTYRTDLDGAVTFYLDGKTVNPELP